MKRESELKRCIAKLSSAAISNRHRFLQQCILAEESFT